MDTDLADAPKTECYGQACIRCDITGSPLLAIWTSCVRPIHQCMHTLCLMFRLISRVTDPYNRSHPLSCAPIERDPHRLAHLAPSTSVLHVLCMSNPAKVHSAVVKSVAVGVICHHSQFGTATQNEPRKRIRLVRVYNSVHSV